MKRFTNIILVILMIFLIAAIAIFGAAIYLNITDTTPVTALSSISSFLFSDSKEDLYKESNIINNNSIVIDEIDSNSNESTGFFYKQLNKTQKIIYDKLKENKQNMQDGKYQIKFGDIFTDVLNKEGGSETLGQDYQSAVETFLYDNPDVFYINANKLYLNIKTTKTIFKTKHDVYVGPADDENYYADGFTTETQVKEAIRKIEIVKNNIVSKMTGNTYKDILKIHDYLVDSIEYDSKYESMGTYSIYGALIDKKSVCEGYAKSLKYLLDAAGIPCVIVQGTATNSSGKTENHAWNCVNIDGKWYYIDATWDDPIIIGNGTIAKSVQYKYFMKGSKVLNKDHVLSYKFSDKGRTYKYPAVEEYNYK